MWPPLLGSKLHNLPNYKQVGKLSFLVIFMVIIITAIIITIIFMMMIIMIIIAITREEHVHELAVGSPCAQLLDFGKFSLQFLLTQYVLASINLIKFFQHIFLASLDVDQVLPSYVFFGNLCLHKFGKLLLSKYDLKNDLYIYQLWWSVKMV